MASVSPAPSLHSIRGTNLKKDSHLVDFSPLDDYFTRANDSSEPYEQETTSSSHNSSQRSSKKCSSGDSISEASSDICNQKSETCNESSKTTTNNCSSFLGADSVKDKRGNNPFSIKTTSKQDTLIDKSRCKSCKISRSDAVAKCFECASYMPTPEVLTQPHQQFGLKSVNIGSTNGSFDAGAAAMGLSGIAARCPNHRLLDLSGGVRGGVFDNLWPDRLHSTAGLSSSSNPSAPFASGIGINSYNIWSVGAGGVGIGNPLPNSTHLLNTLASNVVGQSATSNCVGTGNPISDSLLDLRSKLLYAAVNPKKSPIKRLMMIYHCKFGEFGVSEGQFTEPSGVAVNAQNYIIVADTNNHRIQIFDKEGRFKFQFGECGKRDSQLLYPNRVAVSLITGDIIVTERSPTHQVQIYNQYGQFVRKFGANILQHPRGITVDNQGRIIVVECKVMRVIVFDHNGNVLHKFGCSKHLRFPNGVVVNDKEEIFISDNRAHCVKVFNYEGRYLRQIGCEGLTNYPIGVCINSKGDIIIADNHNNFNLTIFKQDGQLISAHESRVKHAQCFDVALLDDSSVVLASKDYRLYIYRYATALSAVI